LAAEEIDQFVNRPADEIGASCPARVFLSVLGQGIGNEHLGGVAIAKVWPSLKSDIVG
jgi:hypothetical protein